MSIEDSDVRLCVICKKEMDKGFYITDFEYYCSDMCLYERYTYEEYNELYELNEGYYTEWK